MTNAEASFPPAGEVVERRTGPVAYPSNPLTVLDAQNVSAWVSVDVDSAQGLTAAPNVPMEWALRTQPFGNLCNVSDTKEGAINGTGTAYMPEFDDVVCRPKPAEWTVAIAAGTNAAALTGEASS